MGQRLPTPARWMLAFAAFTYAISVLAASILLFRQLQIAGQTPRFWAVLLWQAAVYAVWLPIAWLVWRLFHRHGLSRTSIKQYLWLSVAVIPTHAILVVFFEAHAAEPGSVDLAGLAVQRLQLDLLVYASFGVLALAAAFRQRAAEEAKAAAELRATLDAARHASAAKPIAVSLDKRLAVSVGSQRLLVPISEVEWFSSAANYIVVNWAGREGLVRQTLQSLGNQLDADVFARVHRATIANLSKVQAAEPLSDGSWRLTMVSGAEIVVSRTYRDAILARLGAKPTRHG